jgi:hypothetical protein
LDLATFLILYGAGHYSAAADAIYSNVIDYAMAQRTGKPINSFNPFRPVFANFNPSILIHAPVGIFNFESLNKEQEAQVESLGLEKDGKIWRGTPQMQNIGTLIGLGAKNARHLPGRASFDGYIAYAFALKAMAIFSAVSIGTFSKKITGILDQADPQGHNYIKTLDSGATVTSSVEPSDGHKKFMTVQAITGASILSADVEAPLFIPVVEAAGIPLYHMGPSDQSRLTGNGLLFPYFRDMMLPDRDFAVSIFQRYFYRGLGADATTAHRFWVIIKSGLRNISLLPCGMMINHAFLGMILADQTKSFIRYIQKNGTYYGFVLQGDGAIILDNTTHAFRSKEDLRKDFAVLTSFDTFLSELLSLLAGPNYTDADGNIVSYYEPSPASVNTSRKLFEYMRTVDVDLHFPTQKTDIQNALDKLAFGETYAVASHQNITVFLNYVSTGDPGLLAPFPALFQNELWRSDDRIALGLSIFGTMVPSISWGVKGNSLVTQLPKEDAIEELFDPAKLNLQSTAIKSVPFTVGVGNWTTVLAKQMMFLPLDPKKKKDGKSALDRRGVSATLSGDVHKSLMRRVAQVANEHRAANEGRRKRGLETEDISSRKKSKAGASTADLATGF